MAEQLYFARHTKLFLKQGSNIWEIPVQEGFSFSQATNASEVVLAEMESTGGVSRRGRASFNDSVAPAEWSFSTYVRPFKSTAGGAAGDIEDTVANHHAVEEALWANAVAINAFTPASGATSEWSNNSHATGGVILGTSSTTIDFKASNTASIGTFDLLFQLGACSGSTPLVYKISDCVVNSITIDFDIDGIAMINWAGFGSEITDNEGVTTVTPTLYEGVTATNNFIRNRLTTLAVQAGTDAEQGGTGSTYTLFPGDGVVDGRYNLVLTGGSISFENNITYLTPETLCTVNKPIAHITGNRTIGGNFTCYVNTDTGSTHDLWEDLINAGVNNSVVTNSFDLTFTIGGASAPNLAINFPQASLEIPTHNIEDVISLEVNFGALPSTLSASDEATLTYTGLVPA